MKFSPLNALALLSALLPAVSAARDTPDFFLVSVTADSSYHLKPLRVDGYTASLSSGNILKFYIESGVHLRVDQGDPSQIWLSAIVNSVLTANGCSPGGQVQITQGSSNKCARATNFGLSSYDQNSQLGAKVTFNGAGSFYVCSGGTVSYDISPISGCTAMELWTVPTEGS